MRPGLFQKLLWCAIALGALLGLLLALLPPGAGDAAAAAKTAPPPAPPTSGPDAPPERHGIWAALILATNEPNPAPAPEPLAPYEARMRKRFGYNQFVITDQTAEPLAGDGSRWFAPGEGLAIEVRILAPKPGLSTGGGDTDPPSRINFKIHQENRQLVDADARMTPGRPLFIRGPAKGSGQLIFVLMAR